MKKLLKNSLPGAKQIYKYSVFCITLNVIEYECITKKAAIDLIKNDKKLFPYREYKIIKRRIKTW